MKGVRNEKRGLLPLAEGKGREGSGRTMRQDCVLFEKLRIQSGQAMCLDCAAILATALRRTEVRPLCPDSRLSPFQLCLSGLLDRARGCSLWALILLVAVAVLWRSAVDRWLLQPVNLISRIEYKQRMIVNMIALLSSGLCGIAYAIEAEKDRDTSEDMPSHPY
jgi:hypothetical protein